MKVVAFNGSPRKAAHTETLIHYVFEELEKEGIKTQIVSLSGKLLRGCTACMQCFKNKDQRCTIEDDDFVNDCIQQMAGAEGIILASPTYFSDVTAEMKALIDRSNQVAKANNDMFKRKVGASVIAARRLGGVHAFDTLNHFFATSQMIIPGSCDWNVGLKLDKGLVKDSSNHKTAIDVRGKEIMKVLGQNMAWLMKKIYR